MEPEILEAEVVRVENLGKQAAGTHKPHQGYGRHFKRLFALVVKVSSTGEEIRIDLTDMVCLKMGTKANGVNALKYWESMEACAPIGMVKIRKFSGGGTRLHTEDLAAWYEKVGL